MGMGEEALSVPGSAAHGQGQKWNQTTPNTATNSCVSWTLEAQFWCLSWSCHRAPPLHGQQEMPCSSQEHYRKACEDDQEDSKKDADVPPAVLMIARHCSGPTCALASVRLFPSLPSRPWDSRRSSMDEQPNSQRGPGMIHLLDGSLQGATGGTWGHLQRWGEVWAA